MSEERPVSLLHNLIQKELLAIAKTGKDLTGLKQLIKEAQQAGYDIENLPKMGPVKSPTEDSLSLRHSSSLTENVTASRLRSLSSRPLSTSSATGARVSSTGRVLSSLSTSSPTAFDHELPPRSTVDSKGIDKRRRLRTGTAAAALTSSAPGADRVILQKMPLLLELIEELGIDLNRYNCHSDSILLSSQNQLEQAIFKHGPTQLQEKFLRCLALSGEILNLGSEAPDTLTTINNIIANTYSFLALLAYMQNNFQQAVLYYNLAITSTQGNAKIKYLEAIALELMNNSANLTYRIYTLLYMMSQRDSETSLVAKDFAEDDSAEKTLIIQIKSRINALYPAHLDLDLYPSLKLLTLFAESLGKTINIDYETIEEILNTAMSAAIEKCGESISFFAAENHSAGNDCHDLAINTLSDIMECMLIFDTEFRRKNQEKLLNFFLSNFKPQNSNATQICIMLSNLHIIVKNIQKTHPQFMQRELLQRLEAFLDVHSAKKTLHPGPELAGIHTRDLTRGRQALQRASRRAVQEDKQMSQSSQLTKRRQPKKSENPELESKMQKATINLIPNKKDRLCLANFIEELGSRRINVQISGSAVFDYIQEVYGIGVMKKNKNKKDIDFSCKILRLEQKQHFLQTILKYKSDFIEDQVIDNNNYYFIRMKSRFDGTQFDFSAGYEFASHKKSDPVHATNYLKLELNSLGWLSLMDTSEECVIEALQDFTNGILRMDEPSLDPALGMKEVFRRPLYYLIMGVFNNLCPITKQVLTDLQWQEKYLTSLYAQHSKQTMPAFLNPVYTEIASFLKKEFENGDEGMVSCFSHPTAALIIESALKVICSQTKQVEPEKLEKYCENLTRILQNFYRHRKHDYFQFHFIVNSAIKNTSQLASMASPLTDEEITVQVKFLEEREKELPQQTTHSRLHPPHLPYRREDSALRGRPRPPQLPRMPQRESGAFFGQVADQKRTEHPFAYPSTSSRGTAPAPPAALPTALPTASQPTG